MTYQPKTYRDKGGDRYNIDDGGELVVKDGGTLTFESGGTLEFAEGGLVIPVADAGDVATKTGLSAAELNVVQIHKTTFTLDDVAIAITNGSSAGHGSQQLYDFPDGLIQILGGKIDLAVAVAGSDLDADANGDVHVGTTAQTDVAVGNIVATQHDIIATTPIAELVSGEGPAVGHDGVNTTPLDGTTAAKKAYLNFLFDTADISDDDAIAVSGTVTLYWMHLGDYSD